MNWFRHSRVRSSRGHVRIETGPPWGQWAVWGIAAIVVLVVIVIVIRQVVLPFFDEDERASQNRTWLSYDPWVINPVGPDAIRQLGQRLQDNEISMVYLEAAAWRADGSFVAGTGVAEFARALRDAYPQLDVLLWLRMDGEQITRTEQRAEAAEMARRAVQEWGFDGVQLNGRGVINGSPSFIQFLGELRSGIGSKATLSVTVPPDRIIADADFPGGQLVDADLADLTWSPDYKQEVAISMVDEVVVMAHASGLPEPATYEAWVAYQVASFAGALGELQHSPDIIVALATYESTGEAAHNPLVERIDTAVSGIRKGIDRAGGDGDLVVGVGLYLYDTTDSQEWVQYQMQWLKRTAAN